MACLADFDSEEWPQQTTSVISDLVANKLSPGEAAKALEHQMLSEEDAEDGLELIWAVTLVAARKFSLTDHERLVDLLVSISKLPPPLDQNGAPILVRNKPLDWEQMPGFKMAMNGEWNGFGGPDPEGEYRIDRLSLPRAIDLWLHVNHFAALLTKTAISTFPFDLFCLWSYSRKGLEYPITGPGDLDRLKWAVPGAAIWVSLLGERIYEWEFEYLGGRSSTPGSGGPLWNGKHGFCVERWQLWKRQFGEIGDLDGLDGDTKLVAAKARDKMIEIENNAVAIGK